LVINNELVESNKNKLVEYFTVQTESITNEIDSNKSTLVMNSECLSCLDKWTGPVVIDKKVEKENDLIELFDEIKEKKYGCKEYLLVKLARNTEGRRLATLRKLKIQRDM